MQGKKDEKKKTEKRQRPHHFSEPKKRVGKRIARRVICPRCNAKVRINKDKRIAWHRWGHPKWCPQSATKLNLILVSK